MKTKVFFCKTANGIKLKNPETLGVLAKLCKLSIWQFEKMYN